MYRHRQSRWILLLLPLLAARLLLPPGVMPGRSEAGATLVVCTGHQAESGLQSHDAPKPLSDPGHEHAVCPFAAACPPAPAPVWTALALEAVAPVRFVALPGMRGDARSGPARSQTSRAPPA
jgi:hypothetical protein